MICRKDSEAYRYKINALKKNHFEVYHQNSLDSITG